MLSLVVAALVATQGLDAPINQHPTVRTEMKRGAQAAFDCMVHRRADVGIFTECVEDAQKENRQKMARSFEAFELGLYQVERDVLSTWIKYHPDISSEDQEIAKLSHDVAETDYQDARKALHLTDAQVQAAIYPLKPSY
jgi:hypothetical protein